jgi:tetratricopeptide (TPR) repeat protein
MKKAILILTALVLNGIVFGQSQADIDKARKLTQEGIHLVDEGKYDEGIKKYKEAEKLDPKNVDHPYEICFALVAQQKYKPAIKKMNATMAKGLENEQCYQLLGNAYDYAKKEKLAIETYEKGIAKYPDYGALYLERSIVELKNNRTNTALSYLETGISKDPMYSSNYYWATKIYLNSKNEFMGMMYGEIFLNLERNRKDRIKEISTLLFKTYKSEIKFSDDNISVSFASNTIEISNLDDLGGTLSGLKNSMYGLTVYEPTMALAVIGETEISLESLVSIRKRFIETWASNEKRTPNALFEFNKKLIDNGHYEAYTYWLLSYGDISKYKVWFDDNSGKFDRFASFVGENAFELTVENAIYPANLVIEEK